MANRGSFIFFIFSNFLICFNSNCFCSFQQRYRQGLHKAITQLASNNMPLKFYTKLFGADMKILRANSFLLLFWWVDGYTRLQPLHAFMLWLRQHLFSIITVRRKAKLLLNFLTASKTTVLLPCYNLLSPLSSYVSRSRRMIVSVLLSFF